MSKWLSQLFEKKRTKRERDGLDEQQATAFVSDLLARHRTAQKTSPVPLAKPEISAGPTATSLGTRPQAAAPVLPMKPKTATEETASPQTDELRNAKDEAAKIIDQAKQSAAEIRRRVTESLRSLIDRAVTDAEQMATSIKAKARQEAEEEASGIIAKARQAADELKRRAETVTSKEVEDLLSVAGAAGRDTAEEAKQRLQAYLIKMREEIEKEVRQERKQTHSGALSSLLNRIRSLLSKIRGLLSKNKKASPSAKATKTIPVEPERPHIGTEKKTGKMAKEAAKQAKAAQKRAEKEAKLAAKAEAKKKTQEAKQAKEAQKRAEKEAKLAAKANAKKEPEEAKQPAPTQPELAQKAESAIGDGASKKPEPPVQMKEPDPPQVKKSTLEELLEQRLPEKERLRQEQSPIQQTLDTEAIYKGEIELAIAVPVDLAAVSKLYNYLQTTPDMKVLYTRGSWDRGTIITVTLDKPLPFFGMITKIPGLSVTPSLSEKDNLLKTPSGSLLGANRKAAPRIVLNLKTE